MPTNYLSRFYMWHMFLQLKSMDNQFSLSSIAILLNVMPILAWDFSCPEIPMLVPYPGKPIKSTEDQLLIPQRQQNKNNGVCYLKNHRQYSTYYWQLSNIHKPTFCSEVMRTQCYFLTLHRSYTAVYDNKVRDHFASMSSRPGYFKPHINKSFVNLNELL